MELPVNSRRHSPFSLIQLHHLFEDSAFTDFTIEINGKETIKIHRVIMASASRYFKTLFNSSMKEVNENCIVLHEARPDLFRKIIESLYGKEYCITDFYDKIYVLRTLKFYQFYTPMNQINRFIEEMQVPSNGFNEYIDTIEYIYDGLTPDTMDIIAKKITPQSQLHKLSTELLQYVFSSKYFPRNEFTTEMQVFDLIHALVSEGYTESLYKHVQFINMTARERLELITAGKITSDTLLKYMEESTRFALTHNLKERLEREYKDLEYGIVQDESLVVKILSPRINHISKIGACVTGDGDQTSVKTVFSRNGPLRGGDLIKISKYAIYTDSGKNFRLYALEWKRI